ncbi:hypothetical protein BDY19DRAFT_608426 [Irpex rosettiformis]|uniref:Uncharacterized protein n=1 Tax=Irpex rosettiformis TaxID=378272 RepID=A0ACB8TQ07_9APHY|nr:hypothetical protein BDY19DRAFT_608426 [Irpex rosettiformis]
MDLASHVCNTSAKGYDAKRRIEAVEFFQCDLCPTRMRQAVNIRSHRRRQLEEKIYSCPDEVPDPLDSERLTSCDMCFADPTALIRHRKSKHGYVTRTKKAESSEKSSKVSSSCPYTHGVGRTRTRKSKVRVGNDEKPGPSVAIPNTVEPTEVSSIRHHSQSPCQAEDSPVSSALPPIPVHERTISPSSLYLPSPPSSPVSPMPYFDGIVPNYPIVSPTELSLLNSPQFRGSLNGYRDYSGVMAADDYSKPRHLSSNFSQLYSGIDNPSYSSALSPAAYTSLALPEYQLPLSAFDTSFTTSYHGVPRSHSPYPASDATSSSPIISPPMLNDLQLPPFSPLPSPYLTF